MNPFASAHDKRTITHNFVYLSMDPSGSGYLLALSFFISTTFRWQDLFRVTTFRSYLFVFAEIGYQGNHKRSGRGNSSGNDGSCKAVKGEATCSRDGSHILAVVLISYPFLLNLNDSVSTCYVEDCL